jgi:tetratricopeptide (TPR) repeat protein
LQELEDFPSALDDFNKAIEINPDDLYVYYNRSETLFSLFLIDDARQDIEDALELAKQQKNDEMIAVFSSLLQEVFSHNTNEEDDE